MAAPPSRRTIDNPRWTEICRRLAELEERKKVLLAERTPLHPSVQEIENLITGVCRQMASIPPKIVQEPSSTPPPIASPVDASLPGEVEAARQAAEKSKRELEQAQTLERAALAACRGELQVEIVPAAPLPPPPDMGKAILGMALATAATSVIGLGMISFGAAMEPVISSVADLQALLPVPVLGVFPARHPVRRRRASALGLRLARWAWMAAGMAALVAAWMLAKG